MRERTSIQ